MSEPRSALAVATLAAFLATPLAARAELQVRMPEVDYRELEF